MLTNGLERLREASENLREPLATFIKELDKVRAEAQGLLDGLGKAEAGAKISEEEEETPQRFVKHNFRIRIPLNRNRKPKNRIIYEAMDALGDVGDTIAAPEVVRMIRSKNISPEEITDKTIRNVIHRLGQATNGPLQLLEKGHGNNPSVYRKVRPIISK